MELPHSFLNARSSRSSSLHTPMQEKGDFLLPVSSVTYHQPKIRVRTLLGHCLYRRVVIWAVAILCMVSLTLLKTAVQTRKEDGGSLQRGGGAISIEEADRLRDESTRAKDGTKLPNWIDFPHLNGYFLGVKAIVPIANHTPEYPNPTFSAPVSEVPVYHDQVPQQEPYRPQPDYTTSEYKEKYEPVQECFLDDAGKVAVPDVYAFNGVPQYQPDPAIGSYKLLGLRDDVCFDRFGRYGPYGLGYDAREGGTSQGMDTEQEGSDGVWRKTGKIDYTNIDWGRAQDRCHDRNRNRFLNSTDASTDPVNTDAGSSRKKIVRTAVIIRTYVGFGWTQLVILNFRAMIAELALKSGGEYSIHFLLHVKDNDIPIWSDRGAVQSILDANVPTEFHSICTLWSEAQMRLYYPGHFDDALENQSNADIHGVYRSAHMPLQIFAMQHPEYAHFWNWEMDMRYVGNYYELFDRLSTFAKKQSRVLLWERSAKYYIPAVHGTWEEFSELVQKELKKSTRRAVMGPQIFAGKMSLRSEEKGFSVMPANCARGDDMAQCGVDEPADLITMNPIFDADESGWVFAKDVTGYEKLFPAPPRRCAIITASRLSHRLLTTMHEETWRFHHSMFSEMFPASMALHHGMKAVYAPHPVYLDRAWYPLNEIEKAFNGGRDGTSGGHGSPFDLQNEHNHKGTTWYYNSEFAGLLWRRWLGYAQMDGRGQDGGRAGEGSLRGGKAEESFSHSSGRLCLRSMLLHPIKWDHPAEKGF